MATYAKRNMISSSFNSVYMNNFSAYVSVHEASVFCCFHYI